jgi:hypothetical protein
MLAVISLLPFIALPLSGLVFEISDGYISTLEIAFVQGRNSTTFNERYELNFYPAKEAWLVGSAPVMPGIGIIYTNESVDRSKHSAFENCRIPHP